MNSIPLLRFPFLVIQEVLSTMAPFELIHLSMISKRSKRIVKNFSNTKLQKKFDVEFRIRNDYEVCIKNQHYYCDYIFTNDGRYHRNDRITDMILKHTENKFEEFKKMCTLLQEIFEFNAIILDFGIHGDPIINQMVTDMLGSTIESFDFCTIYDSKDNDNSLKYLLDKLKFSESLTIMSLRNDYSPMELPNDVGKLYIQNAKFVKLEQVLGLKCENIQLFNTNFNNQDINAFLKSWMASESNFNLEVFEIGLPSLTTEDILRGVPNEVREGPFMTSNVDIKRNDGVTARIQFSAGSQMNMNVSSPISD